MAVFALAWGLVAGSAVFLGALLAWFAHPSSRLIAILMAFASGILLSIAAFELFDVAFARGGFVPAAVGLVVGAALFTLGLGYLGRHGAKHRKRSSAALVPERDAAGVVALATVLDGVPEALIIGVGFYAGESVGLATVIAVFLANVPESLSSTTRMRAMGRSAAYVASVWAAVALITGVAALLGYLLLGDLRPEGVAFIQALAGGAFLVFIADAMIPEAFAETRDLAGFTAALGFLTGYALPHVLG